MKNNLRYQSRLSGRNLKVGFLEHVGRLLVQDGEFLSCLPQRMRVWFSNRWERVRAKTRTPSFYRNVILWSFCVYF